MIKISDLTERSIRSNRSEAGQCRSRKRESGAKKPQWCKLEKAEDRGKKELKRVRRR